MYRFAIAIKTSAKITAVIFTLAGHLNITFQNFKLFLTVISIFMAREGIKTLRTHLQGCSTGLHICAISLKTTDASVLAPLDGGVCPHTQIYYHNQNIMNVTTYKKLSERNKHHTRLKDNLPWL